MGLSRTVSEIDGDFSRTSQNFPTPLYFAPPLKGFPLELGIGAGGQKTRMMWLPGRQSSLTISLAVWIERTNVKDGRTDTGPQQRPRLRIASRGKNGLNWLNRHHKTCYCSMTDRQTMRHEAASGKLFMKTETYKGIFSRWGAFFLFISNEVIVWRLCRHRSCY